MATRRNVLTIMGLGAAGTVASDDVVHPDKFPGDIVPPLANYHPDRLAFALESIASEIRRGGINVSRFHIGSEAVLPSSWLKQTLTIDLEILHPDVIS
jgi:hypothetical protein